MTEHRELRLEKFTREDFPLYAGLVFNEAVMNMNLGRTFTPEEAQLFFDLMLGYDGPVLGYYKVLAPACGGAFVGMGGIGESDEDGVWEVEYMLLPDYWHQGYGTSLLAQLVARCRAVGCCKKLAAITDPANVYSRRLLEHQGFQLEQEFQNPDGEPAVRYVRSL